MSTIHPWQKLWVETIQKCADGGRFSRGYNYVTYGAVAQLQVEPGVIAGRVYGSRRTPYDTEIQVAPLNGDDLLELPLHYLAELLTYRADPHVLHETVQKVPGIIPHADDLDFVCTCPDWGYPCKHAVALALEFAGLFERGLSAFLTWRGIDNVTLVRAMMHQAKSSAGGERHGESGPRVGRDESAPEQQRERRALSPDDRQPPPVPLTVNSRRFWDGNGTVDVAEFAIAHGPDQPPEWVFEPPLEWPDGRGIPTYVQIISWAYDLLNDPNAQWAAVE